MMLDFPPEILNMIIDELGKQQAFSSLFACALTNRHLASIAIPWLYRVHSDFTMSSPDCRMKEFGSPGHTSIYRASDDIYKEDIEQIARRNILMRARIWKSIILSCVHKTAYPYCLYIRCLDFDLENFILSAISCGIRDLKLLGGAEMWRYIIVKNRSDPQRDNFGTSPIVINFERTTYSFEALIISYIWKSNCWLNTSAKLQHFTCHSNARALIGSMSQLPKLNSLAIPVHIISNLEDLSKDISKSCPEFQNLRLMMNLPCLVRRNEKEREKMIANFVKGLKKNSLRRFVTSGKESEWCIGLETLLSLNHHAETLTALKIYCIDHAVSNSLYLLSYKSLTSIQLLNWNSADLNGTFWLWSNDFVDWICSHRGLRELSVGSIDAGKYILTQVCSKDWIRLQKLEILHICDGYTANFFEALSTQTTLEYLHIGGLVDNKYDNPPISDDFFRYDDGPEHTFYRISCLTNLKFLDICRDGELEGDYEEEIGMHVIERIISNLPRLEDLSFSCNFVTDEIWGIIAKIQYARSISFAGPSNITYKGILGYISGLHSFNNRGLNLLIVTNEASTLFSSEERSSIRQAIHQKVCGNFSITCRELRSRTYTSLGH